MDDKLITSVVSVITAIIGVAIVAVIISSQSQTTSVLKAGGGAFSNILGCALSPLTGAGSCGTSTSSSISFG